MKAILIARVSTEDQKEMGNSLPSQTVRLENYCRNKNLEIIKSFSFDESAYTDERDQFDKIFEFIVQHKEKIAICCDKVDRLSRNMFDKRISFLYDKALKDEIELHFVSDGQVINSNISAAEKFHFGISLGLAKYYSDAISDNVKRALEEKLRKGEWPAKAPFGYKNIRVNGKADIILDEFNSQIAIKVFELYATGAYSMNLLLEKMNREYGLKWSKGYLDIILKHKFYHGTMTWDKKEYKHKYPQLISINLYNKVQEVKRSFNKKPIKYAGKPYIYRGLIRCADCDLIITPEKHKGLVYYHCTQYKGKHNAPWFREEELTRQIGQVFRNMQMPKDIADQIVETLNEMHTDQVKFHSSQSNKISKEYREITKMMDNLYMDKLKGRITESDYDKFYISLRDQLTNLDVQLSHLNEAEENYFIASKHILKLSCKAHDLFESSEVEERRQLIKLVLSNLKIKDGKVVFTLQKPFDLIINYVDSQEWCAR